MAGFSINRRLPALRVLIALCMVLGMLAPILPVSRALADNTLLSGDVVSNAVSFGTNVCSGTPPLTKLITVAIKKNNGQDLFANSAVVNVAVGQVLGAGFSASTPTQHTITLPSDWRVGSSNKTSSALNITVTFSPGAPQSYTGSVTITLTGPQDGGGTVTLTQNVSLSATTINCDTTPPVLTLPGNMTQEATGPSGAVVTYTATANDAVDGPVPVTCSPTSGSTFPLGTTTINCSATDNSHNTSSGNFTITVQDTTGPVISNTPSSFTVAAVNSSGAVATYATPTANDAVDGSRPVTCAPPSGSTFPIGSTTVTCSSSDTRNNTSTSRFVVTVKDQQAPVLVVPGPIVAEATGPTGAAVAYSASASDNVDGAITPVCSTPSGSTFPLGTTTVACSATDQAGNNTSHSFTVTVQDTTPPAVTVPAPIVAEATGPAGAAVTFTTSATDLVDGSVATTCTPASGSAFAIGTTTVTCSAADHAGNLGSNSFTVVVRDSTAPTLHLPADQTLQATSPSGAVATFVVTADDTVDGAVNVLCSSTSGDTFPLDITTVNCSATDAHGNKAQGSFTITIVDTTPPSLTVPAGITAEATGPDGAHVTYEAAASDIAVGPITPSCAPASGDVFPLGTTTVNCSANDGHGNTTAHSFTITVVDTTGPEITDSLTGVDASEAPGGAHVMYNLPTTIDLVDGPITPICAPASGSLFPLGTDTINCSATDHGGNTSTQAFTILIQDTNAPVLSLPGNITQEATGPSGVLVSYTASADDVVDGSRPVSCDHPSGTTFPIGETAVTCSTSDTTGNTASGQFTVVVQDMTAPDLTLPSNITAEATGPTGAAVNYSSSASDIVDGSVAVICDQPSGSTFALGPTTVTCSATDAHSNKAQGSFTITVQDTTPPTLHLPADATAEADSTSGATVNYDAPTATDMVDGTDAVHCAPASDSTFGPGQTTVNCSATDANGNTATGSFNVTVVDTTPPKLTLPDDIAAEATGPDGAQVTYTASALDILDGSVALSCDDASGSTFPLGDTTVTCSAEDAHHNTASAHFKVTVQDTTAPDINGKLADLKAEATGPDGAVVSYTSPSGYDLVDGVVPVTCTPASSSTLPLGDNTVTCTATDSHSNTNTRHFTITVQDTSAPVLSLPDDIRAEATSGSGAVVTFSPSANDAVDGARDVTCTPASGSTFGLGTHIVECSSTDAHSNTATGSFDVTVVDTTPPTLTLPADQTVEATGSTGAAVDFTASATDIVDGAVTPECDHASGATFGLGETLIQCTATDVHGNHSNGSFRITVQDTTPPALTQPLDLSAEATSAGGAPVSYDAPMATDLVDGTDAVTCLPASGSEFALGQTAVGCSASDAHGNSASVHFTVTVVDTTPPSLHLPDTITKEATGPTGAVVTFAATATDIVDGSVAVTCSPDSGSTFAIATNQVNCSATDAHDNEVTGHFNVVVQDTTPPTILGDLTNIVAEAADSSGAIVTYSSPSAQDIVDGDLVVTCAPASGSTFPLGDTTVTCSATDSHGNTGSRNFNIKVQDTTAPVLTVPGTITQEATGPNGALVTYSPTAHDVVDGDRPVNCAPASPHTFGLGTSPVNCSASDQQGNTATGSFDVTIVDTTPPTIANTPGNTTVEATGPNGATVSYTAPTATDLVDGVVAVNCDHASGSVFALGTTTVTCSAHDAHSNSSSASFKVTVRDTTAPSVIVPSNISVAATSAGGAAVNFTATATDIVDVSRPVTCSPTSGALFGPGTTTVTCSATDTHGNTGTKTFNVTVTFGWSGVLPPVNPDGSSVFKLGSTIPVKFALAGASTNITNAAVKLYVSKLNNNVPGNEQEAVSTSAANVGNLFRYDSTEHQYIYNLGTKGLSAGTWQMRLDFGDGVTRTVTFSLKP